MAALLLAAGGFAGLHALDIQRRQVREQRSFSALRIEVAERAEATAEAPPEPSGEPGAEMPEDPSEAPAPTELPEYARLWERNPDYFAWLRIPGTALDYPVMYKPWDPEHYLHRDFYGQNALGGTPFLDGRCAPEGDFFLIYGHNLRSGAMFGSLSAYRSADHWRARPFIELDTRTERRRYAVLAAFYAGLDPAETQGSFRYDSDTDLSDEAAFHSFLDSVRRAELYDTGVEAQFGDELLCLSTCSYHAREGRFVVVAKRVA